MSSQQPGDIAAYLAVPSTAERLLAKLWRPSAPLVLLDIGSCEGEDSIRYARLFPQSRVFAFEPLPENQAFIRANLTRHQTVDQVELVPLALDAQPGSAVFHVSSGAPRDRFAGENWNYGNKSSSLLAPVKEGVPDWLTFTRTITVPVTTLDVFVSERRLPRVDFMHIDVQGAELRVLQGGEKTLRQTRALWLEVSKREAYAQQALANELHDWLVSRGFSLLHEEWRGDEGDRFYVRAGWWRARGLLLISALRRWRHSFR